MGHGIVQGIGRGLLLGRDGSTFFRSLRTLKRHFHVQRPSLRTELDNQKELKQS